jgi:hypothetical protein
MGRTPVVLRPYMRPLAQAKNQKPPFKDPETPAAVGPGAVRQRFSPNYSEAVIHVGSVSFGSAGEVKWPRPPRDRALDRRRHLGDVIDPCRVMEADAAAAADADTPSMTTQWKCRWGLRVEPKR